MQCHATVAETSAVPQVDRVPLALPEVVVGMDAGGVRRDEMPNRLFCWG